MVPMFRGVVPSSLRAVPTFPGAVPTFAGAVKNEGFTAGPDVTLKKLKETRDRLQGCIDKLDELDTQATEQADLRDDCAKAGKQLVVRARKSIMGYFGPDSTQYALAGGTRASEHKPRVRKNKAVPLPKVA